MKISFQSFVLTQDAWASLLAVIGVTDCWMLPLSKTVDITKGWKYLLDQGCAVLSEPQAALDSTLMKISEMLAAAQWVAEISANHQMVALISTASKYLLVRPVSWESYAITLPLDAIAMIDSLDKIAVQKQYQLDLRNADGLQWSAQLSRDMLLHWLRGIGKEGSKQWKK